jgi:uroporphyrinogen-III decarboxylase
MTRRERLMATLNGRPVDRPAVSFYEIGGWVAAPDDPDPFNIYSAPSWRPLLELAEQETDLVRMVSPGVKFRNADLRRTIFETQEYLEAGSRFYRTTLRIGGRILTSLARRDPDVSTVWALEHPLKGVDDLKAYLELPDEALAEDVDVSNLLAADAEVGDRGIAMVDTGDPLCAAAPLFSLGDYTVAALTEPGLFHRLLEKLARPIYARTEAVARAFPGHLWRICGAEYATPPLLPPRLFEEYVVRYTGPMVRMIHEHGGFARIHCHGRIRDVLPMIVGMGAAATDPIEPPPQGNVELGYVRRKYGRDLVLFGNLEVADIENLEPPAFEKVVARSLREGTRGPGRGFVLMPTACPYGRQITPRTMANYRTMVRLAKRG